MSPRRASGGRVFLCETDPTPRPDTSNCPRNDDHTPHPRGYGDHAEWAEAMMVTHDQQECPGCGRLAIWVAKDAASGGAA